MGHAKIPAMNTNSVQQRQADSLVTNHPAARALTGAPPTQETQADSLLANELVGRAVAPGANQNNELVGRAVPCAPPMNPNPNQTDAPLLLDQLAQIFSRHVVLPKWAPEALALWTAHTYAFELRDVSTYLGVESPEKRCGKTTLLGVLSKLVNRPVVAANISPSAFFRVIEKVRPTLLIDEADTLLYGNDELRGILNAGYSRDTAYVIRVANEPMEPELRGQDSAHNSPSVVSNSIPAIKNSKLDSSDIRHSSFGLRHYSTWCPKVMAAIGRLPDTLADRCIVIRMQRKRWDEECARLRDLDTADLRQRCAAFVREHAHTIAAARPEVPQMLHDRAADIWEPLFVLADLAGGDWPQKARQAAVGLTAITQENNPISSFLFDLFFVFTLNEAQRMFTHDLVDWLNCDRFAHRPWREARKGKPVTDIWVSQQLRPYGIRPKTFRIEGALGRGYLQEDLIEICRRYIPESEVNNWKAENPPAEPEPMENGKKTHDFED